MRVRELKAKLENFPGDMEIAILDGFNGGGCPRTINLGPQIQEWDEIYQHQAAYDYSDLDTKEGLSIVVMGFGCY